MHKVHGVRPRCQPLHPPDARLIFEWFYPQVGPFGVESWRVFCKDEGATIKLSKGGEPLAPFVAWRKRAAKAEAK